MGNGVGMMGWKNGQEPGIGWNETADNPQTMNHDATLDRRPIQTEQVPAKRLIT